MPTFSPDRLRQIGFQVFTTAGCTPEDTRAVVDHLVTSNLFGHDSHGVIRFPEYLRNLREGRFKMQAAPTIVREHACTAVVDGNGALGQLGGAFAMNLAIQKARQNGVATVTLRNCAHVGRVGAYPLQAAAAGLIGLAFVNAGRLGYQIAPFGGLDGRMSTNPIAFAAPRRNDPPIMVDMTTSVTAEGKVRVALNAGKPVPEGWLIDHEGNPTTDPHSFYSDPGGAILPMGGVVAHKGYALGMIVELLGGALSGEGVASGSRVMTSNGVLFTVYNIEHFTDLETYYEEVETLVHFIKQSRLAPGFTEILAPGEPEFRSAAKREQSGITIDPTTWASICSEARLLGIDPDVWVTG